MKSKPSYESLEQEIKSLKSRLEETEKEKARIEERENLFHTIFDSAGVTINLVDPDTGKYVEFNRANYESLGYTREEFLKLSVSDIVSPDEPNLDPSEMSELFPDAPVSDEVRVITKSGEIRDMLVMIKPLHIRGRRYLHHVVTDITRLKEIERELISSREFSFSILEYSPSPIMVINKKFEIEYVNPALVNLTGYEAKELLGTTFPYPWVTKDLSTEEWKKFTLKGVRDLEGCFRNKNGGNFWVIFSTTPIIKNNEFQYSISTWVDITERKMVQEEEKKLRAKYERAQRMEALGTLAGGIAHDFNNLLMGIQGRTSLMMIEKDTHDEDYDHLKGIEEYVKSASLLTKQLLGFARGGKYEVKPVNLNDLIDTNANMFGRMKKEIKIHEKFSQELWTSEVDQGQINQVLMNIFISAWQAMPGGGDLFIQSENFILTESTLRPYEIKPGRYVRISITDNGVGMDKAVQERIFDPFFTTKDMGRGTGLGLASVYGIMKNHGGFVDVYSEKGSGSTFKLYFPASHKEAFREETVISNIVQGRETILLIDDETLILDVGEAMLKKLGYTVFTADNGNDGIRIYEENRSAIDMVILDLIMPGMNGELTFEELRKRNPGVKVLLSSGYSINGQAVNIMEKGCMGFIQKPFDFNTLSQKIRDVLRK